METPNYTNTPKKEHPMVRSSQYHPYANLYTVLQPPLQYLPIYIPTYIYTHIYMYVYMYIYIHIGMYIYRYRYINMLMYMYTYMYMYMDVCMCIYIHTPPQKKKTEPLAGTVGFRAPLKGTLKGSLNPKP